MESLKKHGDPLEDEIQPETIRGAEMVKDRDPGSKGDVRSDEFVRSANQKPNPAHPSDDATMPPGADPDRTRNTL